MPATSPPGSSPLREALQDGATVVLPTDTIPGLARLYRGPEDSAALAACKDSEPGRPFSLHFSDVAALVPYLPHCPPGFPAWVRASLPGPWTALVPRAWTSFSEEDWPWPWIGIRVPDCAEFRAATRKLPHPVVATSINAPGQPPLHGKPLARWLQEHANIPHALEPESLRAGQASTVLRFGPLPYLIRGSAAIPAMQPGHAVVLLCTGNTCRSPLAAALLRHGLAKSWQTRENRLPGLGWRVDSAGTGAMVGQPASSGSLAAAQSLGLSLDGHRARPLSALAGEGFQILALANSHLQELPSGLQSKAELLDPEGTEIADPFGGDAATYNQMAVHLQGAVARRLDLWSSFPGT